MEGLRPPVGRPTKCDEALTAAVAARVARGEPLSIAAACEGVTAPDLSHWRRRADVEPYATFFNEVAQARAQFIAGRVSIVAGAEVAVGRESDGSPILAPDPKYALALLERTDPEHFAPSSTLVVKAEAAANQAVLAAIDAVSAAHPEPLTGAQWRLLVLSALAGEVDGDDEAEHVEH